tara:strand:- start:60 stop:341 length:282 start_codon:yes stop_codon:yes gene_type:complete
MGTEIKFQPTKTKVKSKFFDTKAGDKINLDLQGYVENKNVLKGKPLKGSKIKAKANYKKGGHSVIGEAVYNPGSNQASINATYKYKFKKGGKI